jgi:hypothetical protein
MIGRPCARSVLTLRSPGRGARRACGCRSPCGGRDRRLRPDRDGRHQRARDVERDPSAVSSELWSTRTPRRKAHGVAGTRPGHLDSYRSGVWLTTTSVERPEPAPPVRHVRDPPSFVRLAVPQSALPLLPCGPDRPELPAALIPVPDPDSPGVSLASRESLRRRQSRRMEFGRRTLVRDSKKGDVAGDAAERRAIVIATVTEVEPRLDIVPTCAAFGLPRATYYRRHQPRGARPPRRPSPEALSAKEKTTVLAVSTAGSGAPASQRGDLVGEGGGRRRQRHGVRRRHDRAAAALPGPRERYGARHVRAARTDRPRARARAGRLIDPRDRQDAFAVSGGLARRKANASIDTVVSLVVAL